MPNRSWNSSREPRPVVESTNTKLHQISCEAQCPTSRRHHRQPPRYHSVIKYYTRQNVWINYYHLQQALKKQTWCWYSLPSPLLCNTSHARQPRRGTYYVRKRGNPRSEILPSPHTRIATQKRRLKLRKTRKYTCVFPSDRYNYWR